MDFAKNIGVSFKKPPDTTLNWKSPFESPLPNEHAIASPLFEVAAVHISRHRWEDHACSTSSPLKEFDAIEIYGHIILIDDLGNEFSIFHRKQGDSKPVFLLDNTSVSLKRYELGSPRCLPSTFWLEFHLKLKVDKNEDILEINACEFIDCTSEVTYDKKQFVTISYHNLSVDVEYTIFQCAMLACVGVVLEQIMVEDDCDDSNISHAQLSGMISASYKINNTSSMFCELFDDESKELEFGDFTTLSIFAVPAYAPLKVDLDVDVNGEKVESYDCGLIFDTQSIWRWWFERQIKGQKYLIRLIMSWGHAIKVLNENEIREWLDVKRLSKIREIIEKPHGSRPSSRILKSEQATYIQPHLQSVSKRKWIVSDDPMELVEIFSIFICCTDLNKRVLSLKGDICGYDNFNRLHLFKGGDILHSHGTIKPVDIHRCFTGSYFGITTELEDDQGQEISNGFAAYDFYLISSWYNRRICSIIRGKHGFAALHYTIFQDAVQATLKFTLESNYGPLAAGCQVHGRIYTTYNNFRYCTHYEKKYYQSTLFEKHELEAVKLVGSEIPLSKSAVAVPLNASLVVVAQVHVLSNDYHLETLHYEGIFDAVKPEKMIIVKSRPDEIQGSKFRLSTYVEWVDDFPSS